jgi:hypothetical protein
MKIDPRDNAMTRIKHYYGNKAAKVTPAEGVQGNLIRLFDGSFVFRVYSSDGEFIDYDIRHDDLPITIDSDALTSFYRVDGHDILDHSPQVLGLKEAPAGDKEPR